MTNKHKSRKPSSKLSAAQGFELKKDYNLEVAYRIREALGFPCKVILSRKSEATITFRDKAALEALLIALEPHVIE